MSERKDLKSDLFVYLFIYISVVSSWKKTAGSCKACPSLRRNSGGQPEINLETMVSLIMWEASEKHTRSRARSCETQKMPAKEKECFAQPVADMLLLFVWLLCYQLSNSAFSDQ